MGNCKLYLKNICIWSIFIQNKRSISDQRNYGGHATVPCGKYDPTLYSGVFVVMSAELTGSSAVSFPAVLILTI
jgi:hypothetical protein